MKKLILNISMLFIVSLAMAQGTINFAVAEPISYDFSTAQTQQLKLRVEQIMTRNNATASMPKNAFIVEPQLVLGEVMQSEGLLENISYTKAELTLIAKNILNKSMYYSVVIPLEAKTTGNKDKLIKRLIKSIKVTDVRYTRFIRNARTNIINYFMKNSSSILQQAQTMYELGQYEEALTFLSAMPPTVACYEQASQLIEQIVQVMPKKELKETVEPETNSKSNEQVPVEKVEEKTGEVMSYEIKISDPSIAVKIVSVIGHRVNNRITLDLSLLNKDTDRKKEKIEFLTAVDENGKEFPALNCNGKARTKLPYNVWIKKQLIIEDVYENINKLAYLEFRLGGCNVAIKNLSLSWK
jgi:hypothetical protein